MSKDEVLKLLRKLLRNASIAETDPDDWSGCNTEYFVDHEKLMDNIEKELLGKLDNHAED